MNTLAIAVNRGGAGKSTTAANLATIYGRSRRVLLVDCDPNDTQRGMLGIEPQDGLSDVLEGKRTVQQATQHVSNGLHILTAGDDLAASEISLVNKFSRESTLKKLLATVADSYDLCILDSPPSLNLLQVNVLVAATHLLIPTQAEITGIRNLAGFLNTLDTVREDLNPSLQMLGILLTFYNPQYSHNLHVLGLIQDADLKVFTTKIGRSIAVAASAEEGKPVVTAYPTNPRATEYENLAKELEELIWTTH